MSLILLLITAGFAWACPSCQEAAGGDPKLTQGFAQSIRLLMSAPYLLFGALAFTIVRAARRKKG